MRTINTLSIGLEREALYHVAFAAPIPLILAVLAVGRQSSWPRATLLVVSVALFLVLYMLSYTIFCVACT